MWSGMNRTGSRNRSDLVVWSFRENVVWFAAARSNALIWKTHAQTRTHTHALAHTHTHTRTHTNTNTLLHTHTATENVDT